MRKLRALGVDRMWLGYDADDNPMDAAAVAAAKKAGYLVGPYDSFANGQDPKKSDTPPPPHGPTSCTPTSASRRPTRRRRPASTTAAAT
ncbi:hypothetical protein GCM10020000_68420 [Streptomyces olivoverticillatus]